MNDYNLDLLVKSSEFGKRINPLLKRIFYPIVGNKNPGAFEEQFPLASRNLEITLEHLTKILKHPVKSAPVLTAISNWFIAYFGAQRETENRKQFLVYTDIDHQIPFRPEADIMYTYMIAQATLIGSNLVEKQSYRTMRKIVNAVKEANKIGGEAFRECPTIMPRFTDHNRISLNIVQRLDKPLNCCPSLHIAYSVLLDNIAESILHLEGREFESVRIASEEMVDSVLYTKQHSIVDVAFGILTAEKAFLKEFPRYRFNNFNKILCSKENEEIPYSKIREIYDRADYYNQDFNSLADSLHYYLCKRNLPLVSLGQNNCYFDLKNGLIRSLEQKF